MSDEVCKCLSGARVVLGYPTRCATCCLPLQTSAERRADILYAENERLRTDLAKAQEQAATYEKDWREAKSQFGTTTSKLREQLRASEESATRGWGVADSFHVTVSQLESKIARLLEENEQLRSCTEEPDEEPEMVFYVITGCSPTPDQRVIESRTRVATKDEDNSRWWLRFKSGPTHHRPLSDWDYCDLEFLCSVASEEEAVFWVTTGKL